MVFPSVNKLFCYIARLSLNKMSTVIGWFLVTFPCSNIIQMYPDRDTIAQLLQARRSLLLLHDCLRESLNI